MQAAILVAAFTAFVVSPICARAATVDAVAAMRSSFDANTASIGWTARQRVTSAREPGGPDPDVDEWQKVSRAGDKLACICKQTGEDVAFGKRDAFSQHKELVFDGSQSIHVNSSGGDPAVRKRTADPALVPAPTRAASMSLIGALDGRQAFERGPRPGMLGSGMLVLGYVENGLTLADALSGGALAPELARDDLPGCVVVASKGRYGAFTAWLDPEHGFPPRRIEVVQAGDELPESVARAGPAPPRRGPPRASPVPHATERRRVIESVTLAEFGGAPVIKAFHELWTSTLANGDRRLVGTDFAIEAFTTPGPADFVPSVAIPNGTPVTVFYDPNVSYLWRDGKIVKDTTPGATRAVEGLAYKPAQRGTTQYVLVALNVLVIGAIVAWIARRRFSAR